MSSRKRPGSGSVLSTPSALSAGARALYKAEGMLGQAALMCEIHMLFRPFDAKLQLT